MKKILNYDGDKVTADVNVLAKIYSYEQLKAEVEPLEKELKEELLDYFNSNNRTTLELSKEISCYIKKGGIRKTFDSKKFKEENPIEYENYLKETQVKDSVTLTFN